MIVCKIKGYREIVSQDHFNSQTRGICVGMSHGQASRKLEALCEQILFIVRYVYVECMSNILLKKYVKLSIDIPIQVVNLHWG
jgi:hypothetical protein